MGGVRRDIQRTGSTAWAEPHRSRSLLRKCSGGMAARSGQRAGRGWQQSVGCWQTSTTQPLAVCSPATPPIHSSSKRCWLQWISSLMCAEQQQCRGQQADGSISAGEAREALGSLPRGKSPGSDGLTYEFYTAMWAVVGAPLVEAFNYCFSQPSCGCRSVSAWASSPSSTRGEVSSGQIQPATGPSRCSTAT